MIIDSALAMAQNSGGGASGGSGIGASLFPMIVVFLIFYLVLIRPQRKREREHQLFLSKLEKGYEVLTHSGIIGKVVGITEKYITLELAPNTRVKMLRSAVAGRVEPNETKVS